MGQEIVYCYKCQKRILGADFAKGLAYQVGNNISCSACAADLLQTLSSRDREQLLAKMFKATQERKSASPPTPEVQEQGSPDRSRGTSRSQAGPSPRSSSPGAGPLAIGLWVAAALIVVTVILLSGSNERKMPSEAKAAPKVDGPRPQPASAPTSLSPEEARTLDAARAALKKARDFARANPENLQAQIQEWDQARRAAEGTPFFDEAKRELADLANRRRSRIVRDLTELEGLAAARLKAEEFKAASDLVQAARSRHDSEEWTSAIDQRIRENRDVAARLLPVIVQQALDAQTRQAAAELQSARERVLKWGFPEFAAQLDSALAAAVTKPSPPTKEADPAPAPKPVNAGIAEVIFSDALAPGWTDIGSWSCTKDLANTNPTYEGKRTISLKIDAGLGGLYLLADHGSDSSQFPYLHFVLRASRPGQALGVALADKDGKWGEATKLADLGGDPPVGSWKEYYIPVEKLGCEGRPLYGFILRDVSGSPQPPLYIGRVLFTRNAPPPPEPKEAPVDKAKKAKQGLESGLIGHWKLDETRGLIAADSSTSGNNGTLKGATLWGPGKIRGALKVDGSTGHVAVPHQEALNTFPLSLCAWAKTSGQSGGIVSKYMSASMNGYLMMLQEGQLRAWYFKDKANCVWDERGTQLGLNAGRINDGAWHHLAFLVDNEGGRLYVDGSLKASMGWTGTPGSTTTAQEFQIGRYGWVIAGQEVCFNGSIDDVRIYNRVLSDQELRQLLTQK
jgi:hypothetical protein